MSKTAQRKRTSRQQAYADLRRGKISRKLWENSYGYARHIQAIGRAFDKGKKILKLDHDRPKPLQMARTDT